MPLKSNPFNFAQTNLNIVNVVNLLVNGKLFEATVSFSLDQNDSYDVAFTTGERGAVILPGSFGTEASTTLIEVYEDVIFSAGSLLPVYQLNMSFLETEEPLPVVMENVTIDDSGVLRYLKYMLGSVNRAVVENSVLPFILKGNTNYNLKFTNQDTQSRTTFYSILIGRL